MPPKKTIQPRPVPIKPGSREKQDPQFLVQPETPIFKKHITPVDVFFDTLEGETVVEIGDERETVGPDCVVESPARIPHLLANESGDVCRVLVVKVPGQGSGGKLL